METRANTALIGAFTIAVVGALFGFLYWFMRGGESGARSEFNIVFNGGVGGLRTGSNVLFNGLRVGEVRSIQVNPRDPRQVLARIAVRPDTPVRRDTRVNLDVQLLSGIAAIAMTGGAPGAEAVLPHADDGVPRMTAEGSAVQDLLQGATRILANVDGLILRLDRVLGDSSGQIEQSLRNVQAFTKVLSDNAEGVGDFLRETGAAARQIGALAQRFERVTTQLETTLQGVEPGRVASILRNIDEVSRDSRATLSTLDRTLGSFEQVARGLDVQAINRSFTGVDRLVAALDADRINRAMGQVERFTQALGDNAGSVDTVLKQAAEVSTKLNGMADRIDGLLRGFSGEGGSGMFAEFTRTAQSVRVLAERLDQRTATLTTSISGFTDRTIRDIQSLASDGRRTLSELERTLRSLERNPQRVIFGGSGVPEYNRR